MNLTNIGWCDYSSNLIKYRDPGGNVVSACVKASAGCENCYAETLAPRWGRKGKAFTAQNMKRLTPFFDMKEARVILRSKKLAGQKLFANDMTDWMGKWVPDELIDLCVALFALRPDVTFQTLTKHADRQLEYFSQHRYHEINLAAREITGQAHGAVLPTQQDGMVAGGMPLPNLHIGASAETQDWLKKRWKFLRRTPAAVRFLSLEPLLEAISTQEEFWEDLGTFIWPDWTIIGCESGAGHRVTPLESIISTITSFRQISRVFVKQDSGPRPGMQGRIPDSYYIQEFP